MIEVIEKELTNSVLNINNYYVECDNITKETIVNDLKNIIEIIEKVA